MTRWQPLPATLPREARHLVEQLRVLKGRTGLSLAGLARRTAYSKSSWQRYLSGDRLPPRAAAQVLCRLAGGDQPRLLALWELAEQAWPPGATGPPGGAATGAAGGGTSGPATGAAGGATSRPATGVTVGAAPGLAGPAGPAEPGEPGESAEPLKPPKSPEPPNPPNPPESPAGHRRWRTAALVASGLAAVLAAGLLWALPRRAGDGGVARPGGSLSPAGRSTRSSRNRCP
ncbi:helix-turn-helix domain-containing protein [Streptomyces sp. NPDC048291]|uniref:helix-turn-helix domain-containing protein n=1 Tax=Streptomyces sp. NPDC048291 TaxID=3365530 RepID=UPI003712618F